MKKWLKAFLIVMSLSLVVVPVVYATFLYTTTKGAIDKSFSKAGDKSDLRENEVDPAMDHVSILFLGIDDSLGRRKKGQTAEESRTDAMILGTFNRSDKQIRLVSIPRDTLAYIPAVGYYDKITHAHADGGPTSSMEAVENLFNVPVDYYARVNMQAFVDIVDELGGIEFNVPFDIDEPTKNDKGRIQVKKGHRVINGDEALALARSRHVDTDLGRGKRQTEMIEAIVKKAKQTNSISKLDELIEIVGNNAKHNLSFNNITSLASYYSANDVKFKRMQLKGTDLMYGGVYYYNPNFDDIEAISKKLRADLGLPLSTREDLLDYKVISLYGNLIPLEEIDMKQLEKDFKKLERDKKAGKKPKQEKVSTEAPQAPVPAATTEAPRVYEAPVTEAPQVNYPNTQNNYQNNSNTQYNQNNNQNNYQNNNQNNYQNTRPNNGQSYPQVESAPAPNQNTEPAPERQETNQNIRQNPAVNTDIVTIETNAQ